MKAFPNMIGEKGMDLRDYFAAAALQAIIVDPTVSQTIEEEGFDHAEFVAYLAYKAADAMMKEREDT
jgi:hypothetical protein